MPAPVAPTTSVWPTSPSWRHSRNGVEPSVLAHNSGGEPEGKSWDGTARWPPQGAVSGRTSTTFSVVKSGRRRLGRPWPGSVPRKASTAFTSSTRPVNPRSRTALKTAAARSSAVRRSRAITTAQTVRNPNRTSPPELAARADPASWTMAVAFPSWKARSISVVWRFCFEAMSLAQSPAPRRFWNHPSWLLPITLAAVDGESGKNRTDQR